MLADSDFQNTDTIVHFCGIFGKYPFDYYVHDGTNDAMTFRECLMASIEKGFFARGDVLVLDNASIHHYRENHDLEEYLYEEFEILILFLPTRSPELNPIELLWNTLVKRLKCVDLDAMPNRRSAAPIAASSIMSYFTFDDVQKAYQKAKYLHNLES